MEEKEIKKRIAELENSIQQITDKKNKLMFFVADSKGTPIGSLSYTYELAYRLNEMGYTVQMLYAEKEGEFVGVKGWLGEKYASLPHFNVTKDIVDVSPCDVIFIPELYSSVMTKTRDLRCKKIAILQNFRYMTDLIPLGASWESMGIYECITTSKNMEERLHEVFPKIKTHVIRPIISEVFKPSEDKKLIVNIISKDSSVINDVIKPFKWRYPAYGFVTFRHINGIPREEFAKYIAEGEISIWVDPVTDFGYSALEAMAAGNIVIGKIPENEPEWMFDEKGEPYDNGVWFYKTRELPDILAQVLKLVLHNGIPSSVVDNIKDTLSKYTQEKQDEDIKKVVIDEIIEDTKNGLKLFEDALKNKLNEKAE